MDPLSPAITFFDKEGKGRTSYIGSLVPEKLFYPTPGLWFTNQGSEVLDRLTEEYEKNPYPTETELDALARELNAPDSQKIVSFFQNMRIRSQLSSQ
ncbi:Homeobox domain [Ostreococcus tauri]|uniref:Homeobox domain n=1 Tax=Ostreococcus tauri TaxID=70448 RepID=Q01EF1_OSTTA|nr:Homeobox domain [Ostreococcus tauri]CAL52302.1 Homeobox domain [Ostreococcus tauri]|eukprot:XP_003075030.1 Homeobox domain [Ostreococcus tauri]